MKFAPVGAARNTKDAVGASFVNINDNSTSLALPLVEIYTDGGCEPNPGPGGYAAVLLHPKKRAEASGGFRETTNNKPCKVILYSDSQYLVKAMMEGWAAKWKKNGWWLNNNERAKNIDLWDKLLTLCETHQVEFR